MAAPARLVGYVIQDDYPRPSVFVQQADGFRQPCDDDDHLERWTMGSETYRNEWTYEEDTPNEWGV